MQRLKYIKILISVLSLCIIYFLLYLCFHQKYSFNIKISSNEPQILQQAVQALSKEIKEVSLNNNTDFYVAHFSDSSIPDIQDDTHTNIIWLGSHNNLDAQKLKDYDYVLASTIDLNSYLKRKKIENSIHPLFVDEKSSLPSPSRCVINPRFKDCYFVVVGDQQLVISKLDQQQLSYKHYIEINERISEILSKDIKHVSGIIINNTRFSEHSLDIVPFCLKAISQQIPILSPNLYYNSNLHNNTLQDHLLFTLMFADTLSYYTYETDIEDFLNCQSCRLEHAKKAKFVLDHIYSVKALKSHVNALLNQEIYEPHIRNTMTIVSPTYAGIYNNGDYWIAKDLEQAFASTYKETLTVFPVSYISYIGDTYLYIRGGIPLTENKIRPNTVSLYYLMFPSFADENNVVSVENFMQDIIEELRMVDAVIVASSRLSEALKNTGIDAYYIPQFTNTNKFYPDYDESKKSEVLFVGNYLSYRTAVPIVLAAELPLTIYGNGWKEGLAVAPYVDNRILRKYYSSAKIVLNDTREGMKKFGFIINRIFDATACETLVISDYMKEIEDIYGDTVPMWKTEEELVSLVKYYLAPEHEAERKDKAKRAREITLKNFTAEIAAKKFNEIIKKIKLEKGL